MGFGTGLDTPARHLPIVAPEAAASMGVVPFLLRRADVARTLVLTPQDAPPAIQLSRVTTWDDRVAHALKLVSVRRAVPGMMPGMTYAERCVVGDARDLFCHAVESVLGSRPTVANEGLLGDLDRYSTIVHIGPTSGAVSALPALVSARRVGVAGTHYVDWDGNFDHLDADGYIHLCMNSTARAGQRHLYLCGGSEYGTYFAVSQFLRQYFDAEWVHPGASGEVLPSSWEEVNTGDPVNVCDEPDVRMRTFTLVSPGGRLHEAPEKDDIRAWQMRNRVRPGAQLAEILKQMEGVPGLPASVVCAQSSDREAQALFQHLLGPESRFPLGHGMTRFLSPFDPPMLPGTSSSRRYEHPDTRDLYPELRPRSPTESVAPMSELPPQVGGLSTSALTRSDITGPDSQCPVPEMPGVARSAYVPLVIQRDGSYAVGTDSDPAQVLSGMSTLGHIEDRLFTAAITRAAPSMQSFQRIIPGARRLLLEGVNWPQAEWHPCVFDHTTSHPSGTLYPVHSGLANDIAAQIQQVFAGRHSVGADAVANLAFDDGNRWCNCDACAYSNSRDDGGLLALWYGKVIHTRRDQLTPFLIRSDEPYTGVSLDPRVWASTANPFHGMTPDELCVRGVIHDWGYETWRTLRVLALVNTVARRLRENALGAHASDDAYRAWIADRTVAMFAYAQCSAAPVWSPDVPGVDRSLGESVDDLLTVFVATSRDTQEYNTLYPRDVTPGHAGDAYRRLLLWPQQFQHERWARIARRTALYEYIVHDGFHVPRLYSRKLQRAVTTGVRQFHVKGFVSESNAAWGLSGPALWELAEILWNGSRSAATATDHDNSDEVVDALRARYCARAFGDAAVAMRSYFDLCEDVTVHGVD